MRIAFYIARHDGSWLDDAINVFSGGGGFSHVELLFSNGESFSSTARDPSVDLSGRVKPDGTRFKFIDYTKHPDRWRLLTLAATDDSEESIRQWCLKTLDARYDFWGVARFVMPFLGQSTDKYFCSEVVTEALQVAGMLADVGKPYQFSPNALAKRLGVTP